MQESTFPVISKMLNTDGEWWWNLVWHWALMLVSKMKSSVYRKVFYYCFYVSPVSLECDHYLSLYKLIHTF